MNWFTSMGMVWVSVLVFLLIAVQSFREQTNDGVSGI